MERFKGMKREFNLPRPVIPKELHPILIREIEKQQIEVDLLNTHQIEQLKNIIDQINQEVIPRQFVKKALGDNLGNGLFLHPDSDPLVKGDVIGSYSGEVSLAPQNDDEGDGAYTFSPIADLYLTKEEQKLYDPKRKYHPRRKYFLKVDALKKGNFTRFINHSKKPNVQALLVSIPDNIKGLPSSIIEIIYVAKRIIHPKEQLLVSYEDGEESYWGAMGIEPFPMTEKTFKIDENLRLIKR